MIPLRAFARGIDAFFARFGEAAVRRVEPGRGRAEKALYLTFDDGPDPRGTRRVLALLEEFGAKGTFFLVGARARRHPDLVREIVARGHSLGNHSPDHRTTTYFSRGDRLREWIAEGEREIREIAGVPTVGFRPPAGVRTPELVRAATALGEPIILWETRFFDSVFAPGPGRLRRSLRSARPGDIVLFHDSQREENLELFLVALRAYLQESKLYGFSLLPLERSRFHV